MTTIIPIRYNALTNDPSDGVWCGDCGVPVQDRGAHSRWHDRIDHLESKTDGLDPT